MNKKILGRYIPILFLIISVTSCSNTENPVIPPITETGSIKGKVHSRTEFSDLHNADTIDYANFNVEIGGTTFRTMTDSLGNFFFGGVRTGPYYVYYYKTGYSTYWQMNATVVKDDTTDYPIYMYKPTSAQMSNFSFDLSQAQLKLNYRINTNLSRSYFVRFYISLDSNLGTWGSNYAYSESDLLVNLPSGTTDSSYIFEIVNLYNYGMTPGKRVYFFGNVGYSTQYYDLPNGTRVYTSMSVSPTQKLSAVIP
jgi:hypothetical protein